jgi:uncharacterized surface protein with fasciclin (FAS1) repeats
LQILSFHVVKGVMPVTSLKDGTAIKTLAGGASLKVTNDGENVEVGSTYLDLDGPEGDDPNHTDYVSAADYTFEGQYSAKSKYVLHVLDRVLVPTSAAPAIRQLYIANTE